MRVNGIPSTADQDAPDAPQYMKSFLWHHATNGIDDLGMDKTHVLSESFWELQGGHFRLTHTKDNTGKSLSFAMRVNARDELEFVKITNVPQVGGGMQTNYKIIAKFGYTGVVI